MTSWVVVALLAAFGITMRLLPHAPNIAPVAALAAFAAFTLGVRQSFLVTGMILIASDAVIGFYEPGVMLAVYGSFFAIAFIGRWIRQAPSVFRVFAGSLFGSALFFTVTNFAVWAFGRGYAKTAAGLLESYTLAWPFFRNTLLGDLGYSFILFGAYALYRYLKRMPALSPPSAERVPPRSIS